MIEPTKTIIERLIPADVIKNVFTHFKRQRAAELGADIFYMYHTMNKIYVTAEELLGRMREAIRAYDAAQAEGRVAQLRAHHNAVFLLCGARPVSSPAWCVSSKSSMKGCTCSTGRPTSCFPSSSAAK